MPRTRKVISVTVAPMTLSVNFPIIEQATGLPKGRIIDYLVEKEARKLKRLNESNN